MPVLIFLYMMLSYTVAACTRAHARDKQRSEKADRESPNQSPFHVYPRIVSYGALPCRRAAGVTFCIRIPVLRCSIHP